MVKVEVVACGDGVVDLRRAQQAERSSHTVAPQNRVHRQQAA
jgi:hypothetical protein